MLIKNFINVMTANLNGGNKGNVFSTATDATLKECTITSGHLLEPVAFTVYSNILRTGYLNVYYNGEGTRAIAGSNCPVILVGSGNTGATIDDHRLENRIDTQLTNISCAKADGTNTVVINTTHTNDSSNSITINEYGLHGLYNTSGTPANYSYSVYMFSRGVLNEPLILAPNESRTFTMIINFDKLLETTTNT